MGCLKVLFFFSGLAVAYVSGDTFGQKKSYSVKLAENTCNMYEPTDAKFNKLKKHDLIVDMVEIKYSSGSFAVAKLTSGGIDMQLVTVRVIPGSTSRGMAVTVAVYGHMLSGSAADVKKEDIVFQQ